MIPNLLLLAILYILNGQARNINLKDGVKVGGGDIGNRHGNELRSTTK